MAASAPFSQKPYVFPVYLGQIRQTAPMDRPGPNQEQYYLSLAHETQANLKRKAAEKSPEHYGSSSGISEPGVRDTRAPGKARPPRPPAGQNETQPTQPDQFPRSLVEIGR